MEYNKEEIKRKAEYCLNCKNKPCVGGCPLSNDIPTFIEYIKIEEYEKAYKILENTTIMPEICGRICPKSRQCEGKCVRGIKGEPVEIGCLEAFVGDLFQKKESKIKDSDVIQKKGKKVAVIGAGPCGISCAVFLRKKGYDVTIYEKHNKIGGILSHSIPEYRLEKEVLDGWIYNILNLGIKVEYEKEIEVNFHIDDLKKQYDAVFLSFGANKSSKLNIKDEALEGIFGGNELLEYKTHPKYEGKTVAVIGGGNVAIDVATTIKKLGAQNVTIIYRRSKHEMPAEKKEVEYAKKQGVEILFQTDIVKMFGKERLEKIECIKTKLIQKDGKSRKEPVIIENSNFLKDVDYLIKAIGSKPEKDIMKHIDIATNEYGYIEVDDKYMTNISNVFAGGDLIGEISTVAFASRSGIHAAKCIDKYLTKKENV